MKRQLHSTWQTICVQHFKEPRTELDAYIRDANPSQLGSRDDQGTDIER
jgi:hypothetical protein